MNLLKHAWIPVVRRNGKEEIIPPWKITSEYEKNPVIDFNSPRHDFDAALWQFCIGLFQTAAFVEKRDFWLQDEDDFEGLFLSPPEEEEIKNVLEKFEAYFEFDGEGPLFLQDFKLEKPKPAPINALVIDSPGENTLKHNKDHFVKRGRIETVCPSCCALALFTLQNSAPSGGSGHRTSIRGGGPLNTLAQVQSDNQYKPTTLWQNILVNLLPYENRETLTSGRWELDKPSDIFPWLKPTVTSESRTGRPVRPDDIHPFQMYWGMPRRIRIDFENRTPGICDLCGREHQAVITQFHQQNYGINYEGNFFHPFSPYIKNKDVHTAMHAQPGGIGFRHFHGIAVNNPDKSITPALAVENSDRYIEKLEDNSCRLNVCSLGYDFDNMKCRDWHEAEMPLFNLKEIDEDAFFSDSRAMLVLADNTLGALRSKISEAMYAKGDSRQKELYKKTFWQQIEREYWKKSEVEFYAQLKELRDALAKTEKETPSQKIINNWYLYLKKLAFKFFEQSQLSGEFQYGNPKKIIEAQVGLKNILFSKKFREDNHVLFTKSEQKETT